MVKRSHLVLRNRARVFNLSAWQKTWEASFLVCFVLARDVWKPPKQSVCRTMMTWSHTHMGNYINQQTSSLRVARIPRCWCQHPRSCPTPAHSRLTPSPALVCWHSATGPTLTPKVEDVNGAFATILNLKRKKRRGVLSLVGPVQMKGLVFGVWGFLGHADASSAL